MKYLAFFLIISFCNFYPNDFSKINPINSNLELKITYNFTSKGCSYKVYFNDTTDGTVNCKNFRLHGTVTPNNPVKVEVYEGTSGQIVVNKKGDPCKTGNRKKYYNVVPKNLKKDLTHNIELHDFNCN